MLRDNRPSPTEQRSVASNGAEPRLRERAEEQLRGSPFGELHHVACEATGSSLVLMGRVSSYYMKQVAQEAVREAVPYAPVVNLLEVGSSSRKGWDT